MPFAAQNNNDVEFFKNYSFFVVIIVSMDFCFNHFQVTFTGFYTDVSKLPMAYNDYIFIM